MTTIIINKKTKIRISMPLNIGRYISRQSSFAREQRKGQNVAQL